jgi:hypothetical protein
MTGRMALRRPDDRISAWLSREFPIRLKSGIALAVIVVVWLIVPFHKYIDIFENI